LSNPPLSLCLLAEKNLLVIVSYDTIIRMTKPRFQINSNILQLSKEIGYELGLLAGAKLAPVPIKLRRKNKIETIHSSLAIEGNALTIEQVTAILDGKKVLAPEKDILEVQNAVQVYDKLLSWDAASIESFKQAHSLLMANLIPSNGSWRARAVGIFKNQKPTHIAPAASKVHGLMEALFNFVASSPDISWLLKACIFHYELEFIHPFEDGNGRMGRLWQQLLLIKENPIFEFISTEGLIRTNQEEYYATLAQCDQAGESTQFIEFSLEKILLALSDYTTASPQVMQGPQRLAYARTMLEDWFSRKQYMGVHKDISSATASRDLADGVKEGALIVKGRNNQILYKFASS
jgi:Fic family protein